MGVNSLHDSIEICEKKQCNMNEDVSKIRIILYEDRPNYRNMIKLYFAKSAKVFLVESFENAKNAVHQVRDYKPDVVLMDIEMEGISGLDAVSKINDTYPDTKVMMFTQFHDSHRIFVALSRGAWGYALKSDPLEKIETAIVDVHDGGSYFSPEIANKIAQFFRHKDVKSQKEYVDLTDGELEVLRYMEARPELTYQGIAFERGTSYYAVHSHARNIYRKLHVNCRGEAIRKGVELKLIP